MPTITQEITYRAKTKAVLEEDVLTLSVAVLIPYAEGRTATENVTEFPAELRGKVAAVLTEVKQAAEKAALQKAQDSASLARRVALNRGEIQ